MFYFCLFASAHTSTIVRYIELLNDDVFDSIVHNLETVFGLKRKMRIGLWDVGTPYESGKEDFQQDTPRG